MNIFFAKTKRIHFYLTPYESRVSLSSVLVVRSKEVFCIVYPHRPECTFRSNVFIKSNIMEKNQDEFDLVDLKIGRIEKCPEQIMVCSWDTKGEGKKMGRIFFPDHYRTMKRLFREVGIKHTKGCNHTLPDQFNKDCFCISQWDTDQDGFLQISDLKNMIETEGRHHIKADIIRLLKKCDENEDGQLNFEEFYQLSKDRTWLIRQMMKSYCKLVVAPRKKRCRENDETGE